MLSIHYSIHGKLSTARASTRISIITSSLNKGFSLIKAADFSTDIQARIMFGSAGSQAFLAELSHDLSDIYPEEQGR
jgi:hypothetical protein